jgi:DNA-binding IscR family transcriptional regulator
VSKLSVRRGSKKHKALLVLLEVARKRSVVTFEELASEMSALGLSKTYTEGLVEELAAPGIFRRVRGGAYEIDVKALEKALKSVRVSSSCNCKRPSTARSSALSPLPAPLKSR